MAVAHDAATESHTGTTGAASVASFTWSHIPVGTPRAALVFVFGQPVATDIITGVTYGGAAMGAVAGGFAADTATEPGFCKAYFLDNVASGTQSVVVSRTNNTTVTYAVAITVTAARACEVVGVVVQQENAVPAEVNIQDGNMGSNSVRYAGAYYGGSAPPVTGANSTALQNIDFGIIAVGTVRETTAGQGSRPVGFNDATDDWAAIFLAIRETLVFIPEVMMGRQVT